VAEGRERAVASFFNVFDTFMNERIGNACSYKTLYT